MNTLLNTKEVRTILDDYLADYEKSAFTIQHTSREFVVTATVSNHIAHSVGKTAGTKHLVGATASFTLPYTQATETRLVELIKAHLNFTPNK